MSKRSSLSEPNKSLAQVIYEASPSVGWQGQWHNLGEAQRLWWKEFAEVAGKYIHAHGSTGAHLVAAAVSLGDTEFDGR